MISKPLVLGLLAAGCLTAAAGGAYLAVRQNDGVRTSPSAKLDAATSAAKPVSETEAVVTPPAAPTVGPSDPASTAAKKSTSRPERDDPAPAKKETPRPARPAATTASKTPSATPPLPDPAVQVERPSPRDTNPAYPPTPSPAPQPAPVQPEPAPPARQVVEVVVPASSVVGLQIETSINSETARVEDRIEGRVTRDVIADGRVAIPAGTRVLGDVTLVERGGKMKDKARLGVRFHTLVLADGNQMPFRTDSIYREGASPGNESARKIGGAAVGGAILGAIIGGAKGAAIGGATGAGAGSAVVMAGDRNAATLPAGTVVTVRLTSPLTVDVEKEL
jgi:hypothetical protein